MMASTKLPPELDAVLLKRNEAGESIAKLAREYGVTRSLIGRRIKRARACSLPERVVRTYEPVLRREAETDRADRQGVLQEVRDFIANDPSLERYPSPRSGKTYPFIDKFARVHRGPLALFGRVEYATAATYKELGFTPPPEHVLAALPSANDPGFGDPRYPRHQWGWSEPVVKMVEISEGKYGPLLVGHGSVPESEVESCLALGWILADDPANDAERTIVRDIYPDV